MTQVHAAEQQQLRRLLAGLSPCRARVYGDLDLQRTPRLGTVAFNLDGLEHGLVAAVLNDYFNVAVRNAAVSAPIPMSAKLLKPDCGRSMSTSMPRTRQPCSNPGRAWCAPASACIPATTISRRC